MLDPNFLKNAFKYKQQKVVIIANQTYDRLAELRDMELVDADAGEIVSKNVEMFKENLQRIKMPEESIETWQDLSHDDLTEKLNSLKEQVAALKKGKEEMLLWVYYAGHGASIKK